MNTYDNERTVLSTILLSEVYDLEFAQNTSISEDYFSHPFHKIVAKTINEAKKLGMMDELIVMDMLQRKNLMDDYLFSMILAANPFATKKQFDYQMDIIRTNELQGIAF
jgi:hypothetical protein